MNKKSFEKEKRMSDVFVVLGTVGIVGLVAVAAIALVYNRNLWVKGTDNALEVRTTASNEEKLEPRTR